MLWIKALHIIFMVTWFSGLFYLPRLFVYHAAAADEISLARFKIMEYRLYYFITTPGAIITTALGIYLLSYNWQGYLQSGWLHAKLSLVLILILYHCHCGRLVYLFKHDRNRYSESFYRWYNEFPTIILIMVTLLAVVKPF